MIGPIGRDHFWPSERNSFFNSSSKTQFSSFLSSIFRVISARQTGSSRKRRCTRKLPARFAAAPADSLQLALTQPCTHVKHYILRNRSQFLFLPTSIAQIFNLTYRRFVIGSVRTGIAGESSSIPDWAASRLQASDTAQRGKAATKHTPSPPCDGGEGRGEEEPSFPKA